MLVLRGVGGQFVKRCLLICFCLFPHRAFSVVAGERAHLDVTVFLRCLLAFFYCMCRFSKIEGGGRLYTALSFVCV